MKEIKRSALETSRTFNKVKNTKFLYQEKEEIFNKNVILPKLEE